MAAAVAEYGGGANPRTEMVKSKDRDIATPGFEGIALELSGSKADSIPLRTIIKK
jgi:hypothetical protein